ncbi:tubby C-terminal domain-like protein [Paenibacillus ihumii]|uniref:tubby C-terminal domain-like protein n=1 Tax=Paenibacillus ihumii TaxID=687436 RepID=UPI0006D788E1|nr:hypothetical protein [Paenibacillus ihumii]
MKIYYYKLPVLKMSAAAGIELTSNDGSSCGYMTRTFKTRFSKAMCWIMDNWEVSFSAEADRCSIRIADMQVWLGRNKWMITYSAEGTERSFMLEDKSIIRTHPCYKFRFDGQSFEVVKELLDKRTRIINQTGSKVCAEITSKSISKLYTREIKLYEEEFSPLLAACLDFLMKNAN